jgi:hypothetical protein
MFPINAVFSSESLDSVFDEMLSLFWGLSLDDGSMRIRGRVGKSKPSARGGVERNIASLPSFGDRVRDPDHHAREINIMPR